MAYVRVLASTCWNCGRAAAALGLTAHAFIAHAHQNEHSPLLACGGPGLDSHAPLAIQVCAHLGRIRSSVPDTRVP